MAIVGHWTYSGDPATSSRDAVRFLIQDTNESAPLVSDEEIAWELSQHNNNLYRAAAVLANTVAATFAQAVQTKSVGSLSITYAARSEAYTSLARRLAARVRSKSVIAPYAGGISISDKQTREADTDWNRPDFEIGMSDYPGTSVQRRRGTDSVYLTVVST